MQQEYAPSGQRGTGWLQCTCDRLIMCTLPLHLQKSGKPHVWLSIAHMGAEFVREHFPTIYAKCLERGIDITRDPIPVVPAQHYLW